MEWQWHKNLIFYDRIIPSNFNEIKMLENIFNERFNNKKNILSDSIIFDKIIKNFEFELLSNCYFEEN